MTRFTLGIAVGFLLGAISLAFAQSGGIPPGPDFVNDLWSAAKSAGVFGALMMTSLWWLERSERLKCQTDFTALQTAQQERTLKALNDTTGAVAATGTAMAGIIVVVNSVKDLLLRRPNE